MHRISIMLPFVLSMLSNPGYVSLNAAEFPVIPRPAKILAREGGFLLSSRTKIRVTPAGHSLGTYLCQSLKQKTGLDLELEDYSAQSAPAGAITLKTAPEIERLGSEGYELEVSPESVLASAARAEGLFYACQTLLQLLLQGSANSKEAAPSWRMPAVKIEDAPRFRWRGLMIDCSRTFQSLDYLRRCIDLLARYKMNVLHLHLTDDQGWRLEIKKYPELTSVGSKFSANYDKQGGFYTQEQIKELIGYAASRQVKIVPEIEMPGHCLAALASYPHLSCTGEQFEIYPFFKGPSIQENVFCAGNEAVFQLLEGVLEEVTGLFPCEFVHIGGDEVPKESWKACEKCQQRIKDESLKDEDELQSYFVRRIEKFLHSKNKRLIGWDEILEGGLAPRATVMSWRGMEGGIKAARQGHDIVMSPTSHCYLDYTHEVTSVEKAYSFEPVPPELNAEEREHILGLQGNMWTHIATTEQATDRQVFPRLIALAEAGWSPAESRDWESFRARLQVHLAQLGAMGVKYYEAGQ